MPAYTYPAILVPKISALYKMVGMSVQSISLRVNGSFTVSRLQQHGHSVDQDMVVITNESERESERGGMVLTVITAAVAAVVSHNHRSEQEEEHDYPEKYTLADYWS